MTIASVDCLPEQSRQATLPALASQSSARRRLSLTRKNCVLVLLSALLLCASLGVYGMQNTLLGGRHPANSCSWYTVENGDSLSGIAWHYHITISRLQRANALRHPDLIFVGQRLCVPQRGQRSWGGIAGNGSIRWFAYNALEWSTRPQVRQMLYRAAIRHHIPPRLMLAIAWQESGWRQHIIAWDGGIGVMQLMPYTAMGINAGLGRILDPYNLEDNLDLGATYIQWLYENFHGDLPRVISSYNEGGWAVKHRGIFNWRYVHNVIALMHNLN